MKILSLDSLGTKFRIGSAMVSYVSRVLKEVPKNRIISVSAISSV